MAQLKAHRGVMILILGILGLVVCFPCGIVAWFMGKADLEGMDAGTVDPDGRGLVNAGRIIGLIGAILGLLWLLFVVFGIVLAGAGAAAS